MPPATRRRPQANVDPAQFGDATDPPSQLDPEDVRSDSPDDDDDDDDDLADEAAEDDDDDEVDDGDMDADDDQTGYALDDVAPPLPPNLKEISSLASWTVSSSKPGCSIAQLRSPSPSLFWQSDGPAPHFLNIHFFKVVEIVAMRLYLDFDQDESYTPTKIGFLAGMGEMDLQEWSVMSFVEPRGWMNVDFSGVGAEDDSGSEYSESDPGAEVEDEATQRRARRKKKFSILRAMLVQVRILENHQNGKDTHLRGLQIFAKDRSNRDGKGGAERGVQQVMAPATKVGAERPAAMRKRIGMPEPEWGLVPEIR